MRAQRMAASLFFAFVAAGPAQAQLAPTQDSTLRGLERVYVNLQNGGGALTPAQQAQALDFITLELRKAGVRIAQAPSDLDLSKGALFNVAFMKVGSALSTDLTLRIDVEQAATLARTGSRLQMVTWFYEDDRRNIAIDQVLQHMLRQGLDRFLNTWLTANGR